MITAPLRKALFTCAIVLGLAASQRSVAQTSQLPVPQVRSMVDENYVDFLTGELSYAETDLTIGQPGAGGLSFSRYFHTTHPYSTNTFSHNYLAYIHSDGGHFTVTIGDASYGFDSGGTNSLTYTTSAGDGRVLKPLYNSPSHGPWDTPDGFEFVDRDGTKIEFDAGILLSGGTSPASFYAPAGAVATQIIAPSGEILSFFYKQQSYNIYSCPGGGTGCGTYTTYRVVRLQSVQNNRGYMVHFSHGSNTVVSGNVSNANEWLRVAKAAVVNLASIYCDPNADACATDNGSISYSVDPLPANNWDPSLFSYQYATFADGRVRRYKMQQGTYLSGIKQPASTADDVTISYQNWAVLKVAIAGGNVFNYGIGWYTPDGGTTWYHKSFGRHDSAGSGRTVTYVSPVPPGYGSGGMPYQDDSTLSGRITYYYDSLNRVKQLTFPLGNVFYTLDDRGNRTNTTFQTMSASATYAATCTNPVTCNKPLTTTDNAGNVSSFTYDPVHGGVLTATAPAATSGGVQPQTRTSYAQFTAYYKDATGSIVAAPSAIYLPTGTSTCTTTASCAGTADEVKSTISYGSTGVANNLFPISTTTAAGDGSVSSTTTVAYDVMGNKISEDGPLPGSADTTTSAYNADRQVTQVVGPDPDGAGPLHNRSVKTTYNANGQVTSVATGTSNPDGSGFVELTRSDAQYDSFGRKATVTVTAGGSIQARTDFSYDWMGRVDCTAVRMNPAVFATSTAAACAFATEGSFGPDRISRNSYDGESRVVSVATAYGLPYQRTEITKTFDGLNRLSSLVDARGNKTQYSYDYFGRLQKTSYPDKTTAGQVSTTDFEQLTYDANGRLATRQIRDGKQITYTYDNLGRQTLAHMVNPVDANDRDIATSYDLLGRVTQVDDGAGKKVSFAYDALGRKLSESPQLTGGSTSYQYDAAGRRTRLTWSDGFYVTYDYDTLGELLAIRENGASSGVGVLASFAYDDQGKPTGLTRGNGVNDSFSYDAASRLATYTINHPSAGNSYTFAYNPAGQLVSRSMSNDAYAWTQAAFVNRNYTVNGLNQYTASGSVVPTYDGRGNMTSAGSTAYVYDSKNKLTTFGSNALGYDAMGRLATQATPATRFVYDGADLIAETDASNNILRRYVHIPGTDNVLVWYEGADTLNRRWLAHDERGSTTLITDATGNNLGINAYDEYGIPQTTNLGRFQYTGQAWLPELGMSYYKARMYSPTMGRFMQTDPIGYDDGPNWYNYVHGDPMNRTDATGRQGGDITPYGDEEDSTLDFMRHAGMATMWDNAMKGISSSMDGLTDEVTITGSRLGPQVQAIDFTSEWAIGQISPVYGAATDNGMYAAGGGAGGGTPQNDIVVTAKKKKKWALNFVGNRPPGGPDDDEDPDDYDAYQNDLDKCRAMKGAAAANCYGAAERRRFARNNGKPLPPLARAAGRAAGGAAIGTILYWIISEGSRLFPPRNLVPVP